MGRLGELLVILAIVFLLFGSRRLKDLGSDLGAAIKGFKSSVGEGKPIESATDQPLTLDNAALASEPARVGKRSASLP